MRVLSLVHRWAGGLIGLLLALLGLSGAVLVWEGSWVGVPGASDPLAERVETIAAITANAAADGRLGRVTFASDEIGLHLLTFSDGSGAYVRQDGAVVDRWASMWERPELWLFDLHHHLFAGHTGETVTGIAGLAGLLFAVTGLVLWWRSRQSFAPSLLPKRFAPGPIVKHHRDLGVIVSPFLLVSLLTGVMMLFEPVRVALIGQEDRPKASSAAVGPVGPREAILRAKAMFPDAELRRISLPSDRAPDIVVRLRQKFEWTPNGRTQVTFGPDGKASVQDASAANRSAWLSEKLYPVHSAKAGGLLMKLLMTVSGLALFVLGSFATWSFWARKTAKTRAKRPRDVLARA